MAQVSEFGQLREELADLRSRVAMLEAHHRASDSTRQIISLLSTSAACLPARLPEKTQSASDSPLT